MTVKIVDDSKTKKTYRIQCEYCGCIFEYESEDLGYRPWYPHGFVYCPHCKKPLRHGSDKLTPKE